MGKKSFSTTIDGETLKALKLYAVKQDRALNDVLEEAAAAYLAQKATEDPDATIFARRRTSRSRIAWPPSSSGSPASRSAVLKLPVARTSSASGRAVTAGCSTRWTSAPAA